MSEWAFGWRAQCNRMNSGEASWLAVAAARIRALLDPSKAPANFRAIDWCVRSEDRLWEDEGDSVMQELVKAQFDKQASNFNDWSVQRNREYLDGYLGFCRITPDDELLDLACGTGEFALYAATKVKCVVGVDISNGMLAIGRANLGERGITNVDLLCHDVTHTPFEDGSFSLVTCRNALHHMENHCQVVEEMARCCRSEGSVATLDISAYPDPQVNSFFEQLEKLIDVSHTATLTQQTMLEDVQHSGLAVQDTFGLEVELSFPEYLGHAAIRPENRVLIARHVEQGLRSQGIARCWLERDGALFFKRSVFGILARR
jgi:ubiquinone/menaquinone biosynthesis C-methylase UbiE